MWAWSARRGALASCRAGPKGFPPRRRRSPSAAEERAPAMWTEQALRSLPPASYPKLQRLLANRGTRLDALWFAPHQALPFAVDPWQAQALRQLVSRREDLILCCSRQVGKTETVAAAAYLEACDGGFVLVVSPSERQSLEFFDRLLGYHRRLGLVAPTRPPNRHELVLASGGRALSLPNSERTVRTYSGVSLLVIDEAARVPDELYVAVSPMLAVSGGRLALLSTPFGQRGFFWKEWQGQGRQTWRRHQVSWQDCPRLTKEFIESEERAHGPLWVQQEYGLRFLPQTGANPFDTEKFRGLVDCELEVDDWW